MNSRPDLTAWIRACALLPLTGIAGTHAIRFALLVVSLTVLAWFATQLLTARRPP